MKSNKLVIQINRPTSEVFDFVLDPANTPKWIDFIVKEETSEWPPKLGTIYRNKSGAGKWNEYEVTAFETGRMFTLSKHKGSYHVKYMLTPTNDEECELEYYEWTEKGELAELFEIEILQKLKYIIEAEK